VLCKSSYAFLTGTGSVSERGAKRSHE